MMSTTCKGVSVAALLLAAKAKGQVQALELVIKVSLICLREDVLSLDVNSEAYRNKEREVTQLECFLLMILGFKLDVVHTHPSDCSSFLLRISQKVEENEVGSSTGHIERKRKVSIEEYRDRRKKFCMAKVDLAVVNNVSVQSKGKQKISLQEYRDRKQNMCNAKDCVAVKSGVSSQGKQKISLQEYREKRQKMCVERQNAAEKSDVTSRKQRKHGISSQEYHKRKQNLCLVKEKPAVKNAACGPIRRNVALEKCYEKGGKIRTEKQFVSFKNNDRSSKFLQIPTSKKS